MKCPKCNHDQTSDYECEACGIVFEKYFKRASSKAFSSAQSPPAKSHTLYIIIAAAVVVTSLLFYFLLKTPDKTYTESAEETYTEPAKQKSLTSEETDAAAIKQSLLTGIAKQLHEFYPPRNDIERARNATVFIETPWGVGSGFFIDNNCHIITNKHVVNLEEEKIKEFSDEVKLLELLIERGELSIDKAEGYLQGQTDSRMIESLESRIEKERNKIKEMKENHEKMKIKLDDIRHSVDNTEYKVFLIDDSEYLVNWAELSEKHDLALLSLSEFDCPFLEIDDSEDFEIGKRVYTIGNPVSLGHSVTSGIISGQRKYSGETYIQTDAPINPGNSGGPLIDSHGKVIGINTMIAKDTEGIGFAISIRTAIEEFNIKYK